jgi:hypothetical protein
LAYPAPPLAQGDHKLAAKLPISQQKIPATAYLMKKTKKAKKGIKTSKIRVRLQLSLVNQQILY